MFVVDARDVERRKAYLEIRPEDEGRLRRAHALLRKHATTIIDRFYAYLFAHEHTRRMLEAPGLVERLKNLQARYFQELTAGTYDVDYCTNRIRVGFAHQRIGLAPEWYLGAYVKYLHIVTDVLSQGFGRDYEGFYQTIVSITKVIYLDMGLALDAYQHAAQEKLQEKNLELGRLQMAKRQLSDMIVHDLQNPLTGILSALEMLQVSAGPDTREIFEEAIQRCRDLSGMILNVLHVSRAETGEVKTYLENLDLRKIADSAAQVFHRTAARDGYGLRVAGEASLPVRTDEHLTRRILENLIRNALRHTPKGTAIEVVVDRSPEGRARVRVRDDGPGIRPDIQAKLFEPYAAFALRETGIRVDSGLGLPSCRVLADALGATLTVESDGRKGTTFSLVFP